MKIFIALFSLFVSASVFAHEDHGLGEGMLHTAYHIAFWTILAMVVYKGVRWLKARKHVKS